jgi:hypothetical protein
VGRETVSRDVALIRRGRTVPAPARWRSPDLEGRPLPLVLAAISVFALALVCAPLVRAPVIADDLGVLARSIPVLEQGSFLDLLRFRVDGNTSFQHFLPLAGFFEAVQAWLSIRVAEATPLTVSTVWGLLRVFWIVAALGAASYMVRAWRGVWPGVSHVHTLRDDVHLFASVGLIGAATVQVHGTWSHDPVISYNAYAWPSVVFSLVYLGMAMTLLTSSRPLPLRSLAAGLVASAAILVYELSIGAVLGLAVATGLVGLLNWREHMSWAVNARRVASLVPAVVVPMGVLIVSLGSRDEQSLTYPGVAPRLGAQAFGTWVVGLMGSMPGIAWPRGRILFGGWASVLSLPAAAAAVGALILVAVLMLLRRPSPGERQDRGDWTAGSWAAVVPLSALITYFLVATAIHAITVKVQDEVGYTLGNVYLFYAVGFVVVTVLLQAAFTVASQRLGGPTFAGLALLLVGVAAYQAAYNDQLTRSIRASSAYSLDVLTSATEALSEPERCAAWDAFAVVQPPPYDVPFTFEDYVSEAFDDYERVNNEPYCSTALTARTTAGTSGRELAPGSGEFWWATEATAVLHVGRQPGSPGTFGFELELFRPPCPEARTVTVTFAGRDVEVPFSQPATGPTVSTKPVRLSLAAEVTSAEVVISTRGPACRVPNDPRQFLIGVRSPVVVSYAP